MKLTCPAVTCRAANDLQTEICVRCGTPLGSYVRLSNYPARLFNEGLATARAGHFRRARDLFAAVVYWCPIDVEARNALAMACLELGDYTEARHHWEAVIVRSPTDAIAARGLAALAKLEAS